MTITQLSLLPSLVEPEDFEPPATSIATEAEWCELLTRADRPPKHRRNWLYCHCGTKYTTDYAITDEGKQIILICFGCGVYWRTGAKRSDATSHFPIKKLLKLATEYHPRWRVRA